MKILVISDTHGKLARLKDLLGKLKPIDALIHCGDVEGDENEIRRLAECPCYFVRGNNDFFSDLPSEEFITLGGYKIMITHGHLYGVAYDLTELEEQARSKGAQVVMFGHTHRPYLEQKKDLTILNPGSISYPRQSGREGTYLIMEIDDEGQAHYTQNYLSNFW